MAIQITSNLFSSKEPVDFWVWINPKDLIVSDQIKVTGGFTSGGILGQGKSRLMFIPNPEFQGELTHFYSGITRNYIADYNLEICRERSFSNYPSRLNAIYLFLLEQEAYEYKINHEEHVKGRILKKCHSTTPCIYSTHDASWVDFLRLSHSVDAQLLDIITNAYWTGRKVEDFPLESWGRLWSQKPVIESLFIGRVEFYSRNLETSD